ncbi:MAG: flagellar basal body-associated FliL family protein [Roseovarius sp.]|nr:flagellar basal body-associated FliL family protein [Roseovarius sp.]
MIRKLFPILLILIGAGAGIGAGIILKSSPTDMANHNPCGDMSEPDTHMVEEGPAEAEMPEYVELNNQFVIPVVSVDLVESLVVMSVGIEVDAGQTEIIYTREPKLRDALLQVMFDHANIGGFQGRFTDGNNLDVLRASLTEAAQNVVGKIVTGVVITDIARQDV